MKAIRYFSVIFGLLFIFSCSYDLAGQCVSGKGAIKTETRNVSGFTKIKVKGSADVFVTYGDSFSVKVSDYENILPLVRTQVSDSVLTVDYSRCVSRSRGKVEIVMPKIERLDVVGSADVNITGDFEPAGNAKILVSGSGDIDLSGFVSENTEVEILGSGDVNMDFSKPVNILKIDISGSGDVTISGQTAGKIIAKIRGSGDFNARNIKASALEITSLGSGDCKVRVTDTLIARLSGSGDLYYTGNPSVFRIKASGSGEIVSFEQ